MKTAFLFSIIGVLLTASVGYGAAADNAFGQLKQELKKEGVSDEFLKATESSVKRMLSSAAAPADIKTVLWDMWNDGVKGRALKNAVASVAELVASGDDTLEAAKIASAAAHKAESEGLSGFGIGMRVKKAVQARKAYLRSKNLK
jgi:hypothetical protein